MSHLVRIATIQPPAPAAGLSSRQIQDAGLALFDQAVADRPDIVCLPEYFNCMNHAPEEAAERFGPVAHSLLETMSWRARAAGCHVILPVVIEQDGKRYNRAYVLDRTGRQVGHFDKVHATQVERLEFGVEAGRDWPVFDLDFGRIGIMICYDGCFTESSRILAIRGAEIIFWPSLQRSYSKEQLELQTRSHAYFNYTVVVRSSYGGKGPIDGSDHGMAGFSCICGADGTVLSSIEGRPGWTCYPVSLNEVPRGARSFGGEFGRLRDMRLADRRPETYRLLAQSDGAVAPISLIPAPHTHDKSSTGKPLGKPRIDYG